ncbi:MAG TPA: hypothetical protein VL048_03770 [Xanthobacteraceae bacterium]|nr:hypothetical protein [Xanthobacteraceae bacterium]
MRSLFAAKADASNGADSRRRYVADLRLPHTKPRAAQCEHHGNSNSEVPHASSAMDQQRDERGRFASGGNGGRLTSAAAERAALYKKQDETLYHNTGSAAPSGFMARVTAAIKAQHGAHSAGIHSIPKKM